MSASGHGTEHSEQIVLYALGALSAAERSAAAEELARCAECRRELDEIRPVLVDMTDWPTDVVRPATPLWEEVERRISGSTGGPAGSAADPDDGPEIRPGIEPWIEPDWDEVAPGISVKLLATDAERDRVSMLVRLDPGIEYPPHRHSGVEELHLLAGELIVDDRTLLPGDFIHAEADTSDHRVYSETGCTCVLVTSPKDDLF